MEPEHAERRFRKKVVKTLGVAVTDFLTEKVKTKVTGTPVGTGFCNFSCAYPLSRVDFLGKTLGVAELLRVSTTLNVTQR